MSEKTLGFLRFVLLIGLALYLSHMGISYKVQEYWIILISAFIIQHIGVVCGYMSRVMHEKNMIDKASEIAEVNKKMLGLKTGNTVNQETKT